MKTLSTILLAMQVCLIVSCGSSSNTDDPEVLKQILTGYFDAMKSKDFDGMSALTTPDFVLFEDGKVWNNDSLRNLINSFKSFEGNWSLSHFTIHIDEKSGDITYYNHADFVVNDTTKVSYDWIESATFRKIDGAWKMNFLHSSVKK